MALSNNSITSGGRCKAAAAYKGGGINARLLYKGGGDRVSSLGIIAKSLLFLLLNWWNAGYSIILKLTLLKKFSAASAASAVPAVPAPPRGGIHWRMRS